jgi:flagellar hook-length control protein FliK
MAAAQAVASAAPAPVPLPSAGGDLTKISAEAEAKASAATEGKAARDSSALAGAEDKALQSKSPLNQRQPLGLAGEKTVLASTGPKTQLFGPQADQPWSKNWAFANGKPMGPDATDAQALAQEKGSIAEGGDSSPSFGPNGSKLKAEATSSLSASAQAVQAGTTGQPGVAAQAQPPAGLSPDLLARLGAVDSAEFEGTDEVSGDAAEGAVGDAKAGRAQGAQNGQMSGTDFLSMLQAGKLGAQGKPKLSAIEGGKGQSGLSGQPGMLERSPVLKPEASLKRDFSEVDSLSGLSSVMSGASQAPATDPSAQANWVNGGPVPSEVTGHVVKGRMSQDRLSSESLLGISSGVQGLKSRGGGEMRVRLRPDNLGELHLKVQTRGGEVRLQIQASDAGAKKILEESLSHLKDSLASQNLNLSRVDVTVGISPSSDQQSQARGGENPLAQNFFSDSFGGNRPGSFSDGGQSAGSGGNEGNERGSGLRPLGGRSESAFTSAYGRNRASSEGRLDVTA